jgi:hypothetical protein
VFGGREIDFDELDLVEQTLLGKHDADAEGVGEAWHIVNFHKLPI